MQNTSWPVVAVFVFFALFIVVCGVTQTFGALALRRAKTKSRWGIPTWLTLYVEPDAFKGEAARYRRWYFYGQLIALGAILLFGLAILAHGLLL